MDDRRDSRHPEGRGGVRSAGPGLSGRTDQSHSRRHRPVAAGDPVEPTGAVVRILRRDAAAGPGAPQLDAAAGQSAVPRRTGEPGLRDLHVRLDRAPERLPARTPEPGPLHRVGRRILLSGKHDRQFRPVQLAVLRFHADQPLLPAGARQDAAHLSAVGKHRHHPGPDVPARQRRRHPQAHADPHSPAGVHEPGTLRRAQGDRRRRGTDAPAHRDAAQDRSVDRNLQRVRPHRGDGRLHRRARRGRAGCGADRPAHRQYPGVHARRGPAAGPAWRAGGNLPRRRRPRTRLPPATRRHRREIRRASVPGRSAHLSHRRHRPMAARRADPVLWTRRRPGQDSRAPCRTRRDRGRDHRARGGRRRGGHAARIGARRAQAGGLRQGFREPERGGPQGVPGRETAGLHGPVRHRPDRRISAQRQRQAGSPGAAGHGAGRRARRGQSRRHAGPARTVAHLARRARQPGRRSRRPLLRLRRRFAAGHAAGLADLGQLLRRDRHRRDLRTPDHRRGVRPDRGVVAPRRFDGRQHPAPLARERSAAVLSAAAPVVPRATGRPVGRLQHLERAAFRRRTGPPAPAGRRVRDQPASRDPAHDVSRHRRPRGPAHCAARAGCARRRRRRQRVRSARAARRGSRSSVRSRRRAALSRRAVSRACGLARLRRRDASHRVGCVVVRHPHRRTGRALCRPAAAGAGHPVRGLRGVAARAPGVRRYASGTGASERIADGRAGPDRTAHRPSPPRHPAVPRRGAAVPAGRRTRRRPARDRTCVRHQHVHGRARRVCAAAVAVQPSAGPRHRLPDRQSALQHDRAADRLLCEHARAARGPVGQSGLRRTAGAREARRAGRL
ncbi:hypothetical protein BAR24066_07327 [Burkholderia arboris]|uniref:Uncharacterized protein n=1 Tax=Burkholderia arboris TaxID=488730 RepID=A0A9Q9SRM8_9BURK|nr:hypothetical protein BAR24066_07327 [Burkholderia arboris]